MASSDRSGWPTARPSQPPAPRTADALEDGWAGQLPGVRAAAQADGAVLLELADGVDDQAVLQAALARGRVQEFTPVRPTLTELFREVVTP